jgi:hypothetical protein
MAAVFARQAQLKASGKSRGAMIAANGPAATKVRQAHRPGGGRSLIAAAAADALSADPPVPQTASGFLDFTGWQGRGSGAGKRTVGMEVNKANLGAELDAWG